MERYLPYFLSAISLALIFQGYVIITLMENIF